MPKPTIQQNLERIISAAPLSVLVICPDRLRRERACQHLFAKLCDSENSPPDIKRILGAELQPQDISKLREDLLSLSLFSAKRAVLLSEAQELNAALLDKLLPLLDNLPSHVVLILSAAKLAKSSRLLKWYAKKKFLLELGSPKGQELKRWALKELKRCGVTQAQPELADKLIELAGLSDSGSDLLDTLASFIERAGLYAEEGKLELQNLHTIFKELPDPSDFDLIDALSAKNQVKAQKLLSQVLARGKIPFVLLALLQRTFSNYLQIKLALRSGKSPHQIRSEFGVNDWVFNKQSSGAKAFSEAKLKKALKSMAGFDSRLKGRSLDEDLLLGGLIDQIIA